MKGYKVFNNDWTCKDFQYAVGETYEIKKDPVCCKAGFHFCEKLSDCFNYYRFDPNNKVAEVEAIGNIVSDVYDQKYCTNKIHIIRELSWDEVLRLVNTGKGNTGKCNIGNRNTGYFNIGDNNTGNRNNGCRNIGFMNNGHKNIGSWNNGNKNIGHKNIGNNNTGYNNVGYYNTGWYNIGHYNTGCFNNSDYNTGCFNMTSHNIIVFDKPSNLTYTEYMELDGMHVLFNYPDKIEFIDESDMTDTEKEEHQEYKTIAGYLKEYSNDEFKIIVHEWWDGLSDDNKKSVMDLPNFDPDIFYECTWIKVN